MAVDKTGSMEQPRTSRNIPELPVTSRNFLKNIYGKKYGFIFKGLLAWPTLQGSTPTRS